MKIGKNRKLCQAPIEPNGLFTYPNIFVNVCNINILLIRFLVPKRATRWCQKLSNRGVTRLLHNAELEIWILDFKLCFWMPMTSDF